MRTLVLLLALASCKSHSARPAGANQPPEPVATGGATTTPPAAAPSPGAPSPGGAARPVGDNLLSLASGTLVVQGDNGTEGRSATWYLFDDDPSTGWCAERAKVAATPLVLELPARVRIDRLVVDAAQIELDSRLPETLVVEISDQSATAGFQRIADATLALPNVDGVELHVTAKHPGRWLRVIPASNRSGTNLLQLMELRGYGERLAPPPVLDVTGTYDTNQGWFRLRQQGALVTGCFEHSDKPLLGGIEGRLLKFQFDAGSPAESGPAIMTFGARGQVFGGYFPSTQDAPHAVLHAITGTRTDDHPVACPADKAPEDPIASQLARDGHVRLPGINFDSDSDHLRDESRPVLDRVVAMLQANPALRISINGHTDSTSSAAHNQTLSEQRAAAVTAYLVAAGIPAARLTPHGFGDTQAIAPNTSALGRAQNRRVELARL